MRLETVFRLEVFAILVQLVLIGILFVLNFKDFRKFLRVVRKKIWILLFLILVLSLVLRLEYRYTHNKDIGGDESLYIELSENIRLSLSENPCYKNEAYSKVYLSYTPILPPNSCEIRQPFPLPYSFFVFLFSFLFGSFVGSGFFVSFLFGLSSVFLMFFLAYFLFKNEIIALFAALFASFFPFFVEFSNVPNSNMVSLFFVVLSSVLILVSLKLNKWKSWFLTGLILILAMTVRIENALLLIPILFILFQKGGKKQFLGCFFISILFYIPLFLYIIYPSTAHAVRTEWFFLNYLKDLKSLPLGALFYSLYLGLNYIAHFSSWILGMIGFIYLFKNNRNHFYFLGSWFFIFFSFYTFYEIMIGLGHMRFYSPLLASRSLTSYLPFIIASAVGMFYLYQKVSCYFSKRTLRLIVTLLILGLVFFSNINFLIHYSGRTGFTDEYSYLKIGDVYKKIQSIDYRITQTMWEDINLTKEGMFGEYT